MYLKQSQDGHIFGAEQSRAQRQWANDKNVLCKISVFTPVLFTKRPPKEAFSTLAR